MSEIATELVIIAVLLILNGIFSMSELAIVAAKRVRLERMAEGGSAGAKTALALAANPAEFLSTVQVGITLVGVIASVYGGATIAEQLALRLGEVSWLDRHANTAALVIVVAAITYLSVLLGELVPKRVALGAPERVAVVVSRPMSLVARLGSPIVRLLTGSTQLILRLFGVRGMPEPGLTEDEIHAVIEQGAESGVVPEIEHEIVENVFRLGDRHVSAVMVARPDVEWVDIQADARAIREAVGGRHFDWLLVCEGDVETVRGCAHAGALLSQCLDGRPLDLAAVLEEPLYVPATTGVFRLLARFRESKRQIAVVLDEYGGVDGVVTLDDILTGLVGGASAEARGGAPPSLVRNPDGSWTAAGAVDIDEVNDALGLGDVGVASRRGYHTLAGFLMTRSGRVPKVGDVLHIASFDFHIEAVDGRRIERVRIERQSGANTTTHNE